MNITTELTRIKELLEKANDILIVTHEHPTFDSIGGALTLALGLQSLKKKVTVACPDPMTVGLSSFVGVDKVVTQLAQKNFVISLDYVEGSIEKVSYNIEGAKFNLVIEPRPGFDVFHEDKVRYTHSGTSADLIFAVDTIHLGGLKALYESAKDLYASKQVINIDRHPNNARFGTINILDPNASSTSELVAQLLSGLGARLTQDVATNLFNALYGATSGFSVQSVTPWAYELAAACLKAGARRFAHQPTQTDATISSVPIAPVVGEVQQTTPVLEETEQKEGVLHEPKVEEKTEEKDTHAGAVELQQPPKAPEDWLKPKIFKSSHLL